MAIDIGFDEEHPTVKRYRSYNNNKLENERQELLAIINDKNNWKNHDKARRNLKWLKKVSQGGSKKDVTKALIGKQKTDKKPFVVADPRSGTKSIDKDKNPTVMTDKGDDFTGKNKLIIEALRGDKRESSDELGFLDKMKAASEVPFDQRDIKGDSPQAVLLKYLIKAIKGKSKVRIAGEELKESQRNK